MNFSLRILYITVTLMIAAPALRASAGPVDEPDSPAATDVTGPLITPEPIVDDKLEEPPDISRQEAQPLDDRDATNGADASDAVTTTPRIMLDSFAEETGFTRIASPGDLYILEGNGRQAVFHTDSRRLLIDNTLVWLNGGTARTNGQWHVSETDIITILRPWADPASVLAGRCAQRILLDAGHGGRDPGAVAGGMLEKDVVLDITLRVAALLREAGETVLMTRTNDIALSLDERTDIARREHADLIVSIHANQASASQARGIESYVLPAKGYPATISTQPDRGDYAGNAHDAASTLLAKHVHRNMVQATQAPDRGVKRSRYVVLRDAPCPAVLVECGFLSNPHEASLLAKDTYRDKLASGIAAGIQSYRTAVRLAHEERSSVVGNR